MLHTQLTPLQNAVDSILDSSRGRIARSVIEEVADMQKRSPAELWERALNAHPAAVEIQRAFTEIYNDYIIEMEHLQAQALLNARITPNAHFTDIAVDDAVAAYTRVSDLFDHVDFSNIKNVVMVGCGELPVTALHIVDTTEVSRVTCIDIQSESVAVARQLGNKLGWSRIVFECSDGLHFDYSSADFIYVANMVRPKAKILSRIFQTAGSNASIVVREPYGLGHLWAESCVDSLGNFPEVKIDGYGKGSRFLSRDMFLSRNK